MRQMKNLRDLQLSFSSAPIHCIVCNDEHSSTPVFSPCLTAVCVEFLGLVVVESVLASVNIKAVFKQRVSDCSEKTLTPSWTH